MGKSNKKVKSDRINALRKQYDAFLEEDKKRKERNEYILGRLDKMRYSTAIIPVRHRPQIFAADPINLSCSMESQQARSMARDTIPLANTTQLQIIPSVPKDKVEEALLIQNLSKKFILIPKLTPTDFNYNNIDDLRPVDAPAALLRPSLNKPVPKDTENSDVDNTDWKSKYEILNILKKEEKEKSVTFDNDNLHFADKYYNDDTITMNDTTINKSDHNQISQELAYDLPERDVPLINSTKVLKSDVRKDNIADNTIQEYAQANKGISSYHIEPTNVTAEVIQNSNEENTLHNFTTIKAQNIEQNVTREESDINSQVAMDMISPSEPNTVNSTVNINASADGNISDTSYHPDYGTESNILEETQFTENMATVECRDDIHMDAANPTVVPYETNNAAEDNREYPAEVINVQDFTPHSDVKLEDGININPEEHVLQQMNYDLPHENEQNINVSEPTANINYDETEITEFEKEQNEMFNPELPAEAYYEEGADNAYGDEYPPNQNADNTYYESAAPEDQPVEINEHEESTQPYDQSYEQQYQYYDQGYQQQTQYAEQPGYNLQQQYDQPAQGYEEPPQGYEQHQQGYEETQGYQQEGYEHTQLYQQQLGSDQHQGFQQEQEGQQLPTYHQEQGSDQPQGIEQKQDDFPTQEQFEQLQYPELNNEVEPDQITKDLDKEQGFNVPTENKEKENVTEPTTA